MSFFGNLENLASEFLGNASPQEAADAATDHIANADPSETADHLTQSLGNFSPQTLANLGQQLLSSYTNHPSYAGDANTATQEAGVTQGDVAAGDPTAVGTLLQFAKNHQQVLQDAASSFVQKNPSALGGLAPGLLQGIMSRLGGGGATP
ncbi:MAG: hypothetical protein IAI49_07995 [Candidatus Eremiobacteraeota bacterium]|nr:hypothetical protein [Candidatus Eremiobacteraeota bacterium]